MLHLIAFIVIGVVVGAIFIRQSRGAAAIARIVAGLVGSLAAGFISLSILGEGHIRGKYGSVVIALVVAVLLAWIVARVTNRSASPAIR